MKAVVTEACSFCRLLRRHPMISIAFVLLWAGIYTVFEAQTTPGAAAYADPFCQQVK